MTEIAMPQLTDGMQEGTIARWLKADGETVAVGEELVEIEADKAMVAYEAEVAGIVWHAAREGDTLAVGDVIARIGVEADAPRGDAAEDEGVAFRDVDAATSSVEPIREPAVVASAPAATPRNTNGDGVAATPLARRVASANGVDLAIVPGTGPRGRITRADVCARIGHPDTRDRRELPADEPAHGSRPSHETRPAIDSQPSHLALTSLQRTVARRMVESKGTIPHFQVQTEVGMDAALAVRARLREDLPPDEPVPSVNDLIVKAVALALREHPRANASYDDGRIALFPAINVGFAVATDEGLVVPTIRQADQKSLGAIAAQSAELAERVRSKGAQPNDLKDGTFTVSNLGMFGMTAITPVINPPQVAILGIGAARDILAREDGEIVDRKLATFTLSCDHRVLYGADAARLLSTIKRNLERPMLLLV
jgi:pyruvate dehydrogenase E2 component (dihydrolipoamide acetyltransferase)